MGYYSKNVNKEAGSSDCRPFRNFQIRWAEKLGEQDNPYLIRWSFIFFGYSIRIHHWLRNDASTLHYHDHASNLLSIVLKGAYNNVIPYNRNHEPNDIVEKVEDWGHNGFFDMRYNGEFNVVDTINKDKHYVEGMFNSLHNFLHLGESIWKTSHEVQHYLEILKPTWTLMLEGKPKHKWGFFVKGFNKDKTSKWSPTKYFNRFGIYVNEENNKEYYQKRYNNI